MTNLTAKGTSFTVDEYVKQLDTFPCKMELIDGKLYHSDDHRIAALSFLLENFGVDMAVRIGDPQVWKDALARLDND